VLPESVPSLPKYNGMQLETILANRSEQQCELCTAAVPLTIYVVPPETQKNESTAILICNKCLLQLEKKEELDHVHWKGLSTSMWSAVAAVQVVSWRMLNRLRNESWASDSLDMMYLDEEHLAWAKKTGDHENDGTVDLHKDCNGNILQNGDAVVLIKSLDVKGSTLNAKLGTVVKNIRIVPENTAQIEGRIEGQLIVILTKYVRKQMG
jgi:protein PhnA